MNKKKTYRECAEEMGGTTKDLSNLLTHDETIRGSALALACRYYTETIVKDGDLYHEIVRDNKVLKPATYEGVIEVAMAFELFLLGKLRDVTDDITESPEETIARTASEAVENKKEPIPQGCDHRISSVKDDGGGE